RPRKTDVASFLNTLTDSLAKIQRSGVKAISERRETDAQMVLFTTGRGNPLGGPVPTLKIATNHSLASRKPHWIDFDAGVLADGVPMEQARDGLMDVILKAASGQPVKNELNEYREIAIFKTGVTL
nr:UxaA family hydrolase [bacterium]